MKCMQLEKSLGNFNIEKLCIILLFEADFNQNNKWVGRAVMLNAESARMLAAEQYGSWKQKSAIVQCWNKLLFYDLVRFQKQPAALCSNNAKAVMIALCFWWKLSVSVNWVCPLQMFLAWCQLSTRWNIIFGWYMEIQANLAVERNGAVL